MLESRPRISWLKDFQNSPLTQLIANFSRRKEGSPDFLTAMSHAFMNQIP